MFCLPNRAARLLIALACARLGGVRSARDSFDLVRGLAAGDEPPESEWPPGAGSLLQMGRAPGEEIGGFKEGDNVIVVKQFASKETEEAPKAVEITAGDVGVIKEIHIELDILFEDEKDEDSDLVNADWAVIQFQSAGRVAVKGTDLFEKKLLIDPDGRLQGVGEIVVVAHKPIASATQQDKMVQVGDIGKIHEVRRPGLIAVVDFDLAGRVEVNVRDFLDSESVRVLPLAQVKKQMKAVVPPLAAQARQKWFAKHNTQEHMEMVSAAMKAAEAFGKTEVARQDWEFSPELAKVKKEYKRITAVLVRMQMEGVVPPPEPKRARKSAPSLAGERSAREEWFAKHNTKEHMDMVSAAMKAAEDELNRNGQDKDSRFSAVEAQREWAMIKTLLDAVKEEHRRIQTFLAEQAEQLATQQAELETQGEKQKAKEDMKAALKSHTSLSEDKKKVQDAMQAAVAAGISTDDKDFDACMKELMRILELQSRPVQYDSVTAEEYLLPKLRDAVLWKSDVEMKEAWDSCQAWLGDGKVTENDLASWEDYVTVEKSVRKAELKALLKREMASGTSGSLQDAIRKAKKDGATDEEVKSAQDKLKDLLKAKLDREMASGDSDSLQAAITEAQYADMTKAELKSAQDRLRDLQRQAVGRRKSMSVGKDKEPVPARRRARSEAEASSFKPGAKDPALKEAEEKRAQERRKRFSSAKRRLEAGDSILVAYQQIACTAPDGAIVQVGDVGKISKVHPAPSSGQGLADVDFRLAGQATVGLGDLDPHNAWLVRDEGLPKKVRMNVSSDASFALPFVEEHKTHLPEDVGADIDSGTLEVTAVVEGKKAAGQSVAEGWKLFSIGGREVRSAQDVVKVIVDHRNQLRENGRTYEIVDVIFVQDVKPGWEQFAVVDVIDRLGLGARGRVEEVTEKNYTVHLPALGGRTRKLTIWKHPEDGARNLGRVLRWPSAVHYAIPKVHYAIPKEVTVEFDEPAKLRGRLAWKSGSSLGAELEEDEGRLKIASIKDGGAVDRHNKQRSLRAWLKVNVGDFVTVVNGVEGNCKKMGSELVKKGGKKVTIVIPVANQRRQRPEQLPGATDSGFQSTSTASQTPVDKPSRKRRARSSSTSSSSSSEPPSGSRTPEAAASQRPPPDLPPVASKRWTPPEDVVEDEAGLKTYWVEESGEDAPGTWYTLPKDEDEMQVESAERRQLHFVQEHGGIESLKGQLKEMRKKQNRFTEWDEEKALAMMLRNMVLVKGKLDEAVKSAKESKDIEKLKEALELAKERGLRPVDCTEAQELVDGLRERKAREEALAQWNELWPPARASGDIQKMRDAIDKANWSPEWGDDCVHIKKELEEAEETVTCLECKVKLEKTMQPGSSADSLQRAIEEAKKARVDEEDVKAAEEELRQRRKAELDAAMQLEGDIGGTSSSSSSSSQTLATALEKMEALGVTDGLQVAKEKLLQRRKAELEAAMTAAGAYDKSGDPPSERAVSELRAAIERAVGAGATEGDVRAGQEGAAMCEKALEQKNARELLGKAVRFVELPGEQLAEKIQRLEKAIEASTKAELTEGEKDFAKARREFVRLKNEQAREEWTAVLEEFKAACDARIVKDAREALRKLEGCPGSEEAKRRLEDSQQVRWLLKEEAIIEAPSKLKEAMKKFGTGEITAEAVKEKIEAARQVGLPEAEIQGWQNVLSDAQKSEVRATLAQQVGRGDGSIRVDNESGFGAGDFVAISGEGKSEFHMVKDLNSEWSELILEDELMSDYKKGAAVVKQAKFADDVVRTFTEWKVVHGKDWYLAELRGTESRMQKTLWLPEEKIHKHFVMRMQILKEQQALRKARKLAGFTRGNGETAGTDHTDSSTSHKDEAPPRRRSSSSRKRRGSSGSSLGPDAPSSAASKQLRRSSSSSSLNSKSRTRTMSHRDIQVVED